MQVLCVVCVHSHVMCCDVLMSSCDFDRLSINASAFLEKNLDLLGNFIEDYGQYDSPLAPPHHLLTSTANHQSAGSECICVRVFELN
jgi:hypothetical protein